MADPPVLAGSAMSSLAPRMAERTHVHTSDVVATTGMRSHIGEKAKLHIVGTIQIFHSATTSSLKLAKYRSRASASVLPSASSRMA